MTPQERQLVAELFDRVAALESEPRDREAEAVIAQGLRRAPNAVYALVQTVLVQDEALKAADARIRELEEAVGGGREPGRQQGGFLDNMRGAIFGRRDEGRPGSVPSVRPGGEPMGAPGGPWQQPGAGGPYQQPGPGGPYQQQPSSGGSSFLGTAAAVAAGAIGGGLLLSGIRGMLGSHQPGGAFAGTFDQLGSGDPGGRSSWSGGGSDELARQAGIDDIGRGGSSGYGNVEDRRAGLVDEASDDHDSDDDSDLDDSDDGGSDGDTD